MKFEFLLLALLFTIYSWAQQPISPLAASFQDYLEMKKESTYGLEWVSLGPVVNSARVEAVQVDPTKPGTMYVAFGSGNLWKTTNNGLHWKPIFENQAAVGIGDIALAPSNPNIIYVGTGESLKKGRNFTMPGTGIYRSDDGGENWRHLGLEDSWHIGEIAVHPENPDIVLVAVLGHFWSTNTNRGLYRTEDGGITWKQVLYVNEKTGANDIVIAPSNPNYMYASLWENYPGISGPNSGVYRSIDAGKSWMKCEEGLPQGAKNGRTGLAVSYSNPEKVYALMDNLNKNKQRAAEVYKSVDAGLNWTKTHEEDLLFFPGIGWYFTDIYVSPKDDEEIFALGVRLAHSTDGGAFFDYIGGAVYHIFPSAADHLHLDHCELWINPENPNHLALGNDGGFYLSYDKGNTWTHFNNLPTGEFYDIAIDQKDPYQIYGGVQDDATVFGPPKEWNPEFDDDWKYLWIDAWSGGDGCHTFVDPDDPQTIYFSLQNGAVRRKDLQTNKSVSIRPALPASHTESLAFNFIGPYLLSQYDSKTLYIAGNYVFKSTNQGEDWTLISEDIAKSTNPQKTALAAGAIAESPLQQGLLYVGTDKGGFWMTKDDGQSWKEHSVGLPNNYIRSIFPSQHEVSRVYLALNGMNYDDLNTYLYVSEDYGATWTSIKANLPNEVANVILEDPEFENILYLGSSRGVYISVNRGQTWSLLGQNTAAMSISDLEFHQASEELIAATHGRGIYKMNVAPIHESRATDYPSNSAWLFDVPTAVRPRFRDTHGDPDYSTIEKVPFTFYLQEAGKVSLRILDDKEGLIWSKDIAGQVGFNQFRWDLILKKVKSANPYFIHYDQFIPAGEYHLILKTETGSWSQALTVEQWQ